MAVKLRLQRHGRKKKPFYYIVAADERAPRDGRFIERIGSYNPNTDPATIDLNLDASVQWLQNGAIPTHTVRAILSYKGALYKNHLLKGVTKGALTEEQAESKFSEWLSNKEGLIQSKVEKLNQETTEEAEKRLAAERAIREEREKALLAKNSELTEEVAEEATAESEGGEEESTQEAAEAAAETVETEGAEEAKEVVAEAEEKAEEEEEEAAPAEDAAEEADKKEEKPAE
jgi:small subunit ribosomal protein S16